MTSQKWVILDTGKSSAEKNMAIDTQLLEEMVHNQTKPILHLYDWNSPSVTHGVFTDPSRFINMNIASELGLELAQRPTGGGMIFHLTDFAFSMLLPASHPGYSVNILDNYAFVNHLIIKAIQAFTHHQTLPHLLPVESPPQHSICKHFCMAKPTKYDIMLEGRKVGGAAQRRTKHGFLHQGSISLALPPFDYLEKVLLPHQGLIETMQATTFALLSGQITLSHLDEARQTMRQILREVVCQS